MALADYLEEAGTPGRAAAAKLVRRAARVLQEGGTYESQRNLKLLRASLARKHPAAVGWFQWWFADTAAATLELHKKPDRRQLARFVLRCVHETPVPGGGFVAARIDTTASVLLYWLERVADGHNLTESDWRGLCSYFPRGRRESWKKVAIGAPESWSTMLVPPTILCLADPRANRLFACWAACYVAARCATASISSWMDLRRVVDLHRRLLHECVACPFDVEGDA
jgi:hypothetical protein